MSIDWISRSRDLRLGVRNLVDGRWRETTGEPLEKHSPRDGRLLCRFGSGEPRDADEAVRSARQAFDDGRWSSLPVGRRKEALLKLASLIEHHGEELALLECVDVGKPIRDACNIDVPLATAVLRFNAEAVDKFSGKVYGVDASSLSYQLRRPAGVVAGIIGWNFPLVLAAMKIGPALATGNSLVLKPSELTSFSAARVAELALEAGVPSGVLNVIHGGSSIGAALAHHPDVDLLTFTGSTDTGKNLLMASGRSNMKRLILECGGKSPNIVFDDAPDLAAVAAAILGRAFWNQGQVCTASSRVLVHESMKDELLSHLIRKAGALVPADPLLAETRFGPVVSRAHQRKVCQFIESGELEGARLIYQSRIPPPNADGFYIPPTIFDNVLSLQKVAQAEIFGPVLSVISFRDDEDAIRIANDTIYGLSAIVWTTSPRRAHRLAQGIRAGWIVIHSTEQPSGGPSEGVLSIGGHKQSGIGVEGGIDGLEAYTTTTAVQWFV